jgi:hypothetical protein
MPAPVAGIHAYSLATIEGVDGRDKPGHDIYLFQDPVKVGLRFSMKARRPSW